MRSRANVGDASKSRSSESCSGCYRASAVGFLSEIHEGTDLRQSAKQLLTPPSPRPAQCDLPEKSLAELFHRMTFAMKAAPNNNLARMQFSVPSTKPDVGEVVDRIHAFAADHLCEPAALHRAQLVSNEVINNALIHGNGSDPNKMIRVEAVANGAFFTLRVEDEGHGFDLQAVPDPLQDENIMRDHGRGLHLIKELADVVAFECEGRCVSVTIRE